MKIDVRRITAQEYEAAHRLLLRVTETDTGADWQHEEEGYPVLGSFPNPWTDSGPILCCEKPLEAAGTEEPFDSPAAEGYSLR